MTVKVWKERFNVFICPNCNSCFTVKKGLDVDVWCCKTPDLIPANINKTNSVFMDSFGDGYEVRKYVKAFTYEPKIEGVRNGTIRQTIRPFGNQPIEKGDQILFHGWKDRPYHSAWSWRTRVIVTHVDQCEMFKQGIWFHEGIFFRWIDLSVTAKKDGIKKFDYTNEGISMGILFNEMYPDLPEWNQDLKGKDMEIIEWELIE